MMKNPLFKKVFLQKVKEFQELLQKIEAVVGDVVVFDRETSHGKSVLPCESPASRLWTIEGEHVLLHFHEFQARAWRSRKSLIALIAGTGGGKTSFGVWWLLREIAARPGAVAMVVSPTYPMLQRVIIPAFLEATQALHLRANYNKREFVFSWGARQVYFYSAQQPTRLEGVHADVIWMDEAGQMPEEIWEVVRRRRAVKQGRLLITTTPYRCFHWLRDLFVAWQAGEEQDADIYVFPSIANPAYPREEFERARRTLPAWKFKMFYEGIFTRPEGLVFYAFSPECVVDEIPGEPEVVIAGVDFGMVHPTAIVTLYRRGDAYVVVHEYQRAGLSLKQHAREWLQSLRSRGIRVPARMFCDPSSPQLVNEFAARVSEACSEMSLPVPAVARGDNAVEAGVERVNELFLERKLLIHRSCSQLIRDIENYFFDERGRPRKENDHLPDALRYAVYSDSAILTLRVY